MKFLLVLSYLSSVVFQSGNAPALFERVVGYLPDASQPISACASAEAGNKKTGKVLPPLGRLMREEFLLDPNFIQLNHGSYGTYPKAVQTALRTFQDRSEWNAELWIRREARTELDAVRQKLGEYLNADADDLVMVPNTTGGINAIFRSMFFQAGDKILHFSTIYGAMRSLIEYISDLHNRTVIPVEFEVNYPITNAQLLENFIEFVDKNHSSDSPIKIALVDHITSVPAVINPIVEIIEILKARNILVLIDGAHAIGQVPIDLKALNPDYYITNCHKWLYAARGSAVLYVDKARQPTIHPVQISFHYAMPSRFQDEFFWTGTMDYSSHMTVPAAIEFRRTIGEDVLRNYTHQLALQGGRYLADRFGTQILQEEDQIGFMVDVGLPLNNPDNPILTSSFWLDSLLSRFNLYAAAYKHNSKWWIRVSAQIYTDMTDFEAAAVAFETICNEINSNKNAV